MITPLLLTLLAAPAADPAPARSAEAILDDYATAVGGEAAWKRHKNVRMKREVELKGMNMSGTDERYATSAGKALSVITLPGIGNFRQGSDGKVRWSEDPINGLRVLSVFPAGSPEDSLADRVQQGPVFVGQQMDVFIEAPPVDPGRNP